MERSITEHNGAGYGENYLFVFGAGCDGRLQFERIAKWPKISIPLSKRFPVQN
jgi:hypothetical protein